MRDEENNNQKNKRGNHQIPGMCILWMWEWGRATKQHDTTPHLATRSMASSTCTNYEIDNKLGLYPQFNLYMHKIVWRFT